MFDRRNDLVKFLAAAETLGIAQPALTRAIARLEKRFGGKLFERLPTGVRPTPLGAAAAELARGVLREIEAAEEKMEAAVSGRTGRFRITATAMWMQAVLAPACEAFRGKLPGVELVLRTAPFAEGLRLLTRGESDLHCGGLDAGDPLPAFLRRDSFLDLTAGIVAGEGHPLLDASPAPPISPHAPGSTSTAPGRRAFSRQRRTPTGPASTACWNVCSATPEARRDHSQGRRGRAVPDGSGPLARLAAARLPRPAGRPPAQAPASFDRTIQLPDRLRRAPLGRGPRVVPGPGGHRARCRP